MKAFVRHILLLFAGWITVHSVIVGYIGQSGRDFLINDAGSTKERFDDFERWCSRPSNLPRALIVGSSTAYRNIDPAILDSLTSYSWFNLASSSQTIDVSAVLSKIALNRMRKIDLLLIDVYPEIDSVENYEAVYDWVNNSRLSMIEKWKVARTADVDLRLLNAGYYRWIQLLLGWEENLQPTTNKGNYLGKGYAYSLKSPNLAWPTKRKHKNIRLSQKVLDLIQWAENEQIKVIVNIAPDLSYHYSHDMSSATRTVFLHNSFLERPIDVYRLFYDSHHMTRQGGIAYSIRMAEMIKRFQRKI